MDEHYRRFKLQRKLERQLARKQNDVLKWLDGVVLGSEGPAFGGHGEDSGWNIWMDKKLGEGNRLAAAKYCQGR